MSKEIVGCDELYVWIIDTISEFDGQTLQDIANGLLPEDVKYLGDSLFEVKRGEQNE